MTNVVPQFMAEEYTIWAVVGEGILWICVGAAIHYRYRNSLRWN
ncbi:MAG: hypothetical protein Q4P66_04555 [Actinomycetaceae bacterium]|nr:hypothetical protein [Actinomycetaceae bacterium]